jgi:transcriptional regulator with XRE-family HTH domain
MTTLEDYRLRCGWSRNQMAREANIDGNTLLKAFRGQSISIATADKIATAISRKLGHSIQWQDIKGLNVNA